MKCAECGLNLSDDPQIVQKHYRSEHVKAGVRLDVRPLTESLVTTCATIRQLQDTLERLPKCMNGVEQCIINLDAAIGVWSKRIADTEKKKKT